MFAFVKYIEDNLDYVVDVSKVKKFNPETFNEKKAYKVQYEDGKYYKAYVVCLAETEELAKAKAKEKRFRMPCKKFIEMETTTEDEAESDKDNQRQVLEQVKENKTLSKETKSKITKEQYENLMPCLTSRNTLHNLTNNETHKNDVIEQMKKNEIRLLKKIEELEELNKKLQNVVINKFEELTKNNVLMKDINPPKTEFNIGERKDGQVHLGKDVWIPEQTYDAICSRHYKKESLFIKEMALAVFGRHVLSTSSVTGLVSNRNKGESITPKPKLNSTKLMAIHDITRHYLQERGESPEVVNKICSMINYRISEKIQDLNRPAKKKNVETEENNNNQARDITEEYLLNAEIVFQNETEQ